MKRVLHVIVVAFVAGQALVIGQGAEIAKILGAARTALGGEQKLAAVKTLSAIGRTTRPRPDGTSAEQEFELSMELPEKYMRREVLMAMGPTSIYRNTGFNGEGLINLTDTPPALSSGGGVHIMMAGPGGAGSNAQMTPEQMADVNRRTLLGYKQDFARLTLGMFAGSFSGYPVQFSYAGQAESADGKADVIEVKGDGGFVCKLFVDTNTHLPLMLSWMDKEPLVMSMGPGRGGQQQMMSGGGLQVIGGGRAGGGQMSREDLDKMMSDAQERMKEAEAKRRTVEYRMFYGDYKVFDGVKLPTRIQRTVEGKPSEEIAFDKVKLNAKIDSKKFEVTK